MSFAGSGYADDVMVMAPCVRDRQEPLYISKSFAIEYNVFPWYRDFRVIDKTVALPSYL